MAQTRFIANLESSRGLAALLVCLFHAGAIRVGPLGRIVDESSILYVVLNGHGAVVFFFVLSGYVLRLSLAGKIALLPGSLSLGYFNARVFRLFPVIIATVALFSFLLWWADKKAFDPGLILQNMALIDASIVGPFWTLQAEVFGSTLVLAAFLLERRFGFPIVLALTVLLVPLSFITSSGIITPYVHAGYLYPFMVGFSLAATSWSLHRSRAVSAAILVAALAVFLAANATGDVFKQWRMLATVISAAVIIAMLAEERNRNLLAWPPLRMLGTLSFSFYAVHPIALWLVQKAVRNLDTSMPRAAVVGVVFAAVVAASVVIAALMHNIVERPGIAAGKRLSMLWRERRTRTVARNEPQQETSG